MELGVEYYDYLEIGWKLEHDFFIQLVDLSVQLKSWYAISCIQLSKLQILLRYNSFQFSQFSNIEKLIGNQLFVGCVGLKTQKECDGIKSSTVLARHTCQD